MAKRILISISHTPPADSFVAAMRDLARGAGATVRLLHVARTPDNVVDDDGRVIAYADQESARLEAEALDFLETIALALDADATESAVRFGEPAREILTEAAEWGADLIVLSARRRWRCLLLGGVADRVLSRADTPVALLRAARRETGEPRLPQLHGKERLA
jgi:nucleotide-binding universal stress UspA family protein